MPMFMLSFRFPDSAPSAAEVVCWMEAEVGPRRVRHLEDLHVRGDVVSVCSMNFVMLVYMAKVCLARGAVGLDGTRQREVPLVVPAWAERRWVDYCWFQRLRISLGLMTLSMPPPLR